MTVRENQPGEGDVPKADPSIREWEEHSPPSASMKKKWKKSSRTERCVINLQLFSCGQDQHGLSVLGFKEIQKCVETEPRLSSKFRFKVRLSDVSRKSLFNVFSAQLRQQACFQKALCSRWVVRFNEARKVGGKTRF